MSIMTRAETASGTYWRHDSSARRRDESTREDDGAKHCDVLDEQSDGVHTNDEGPRSINFTCLLVLDGTAVQP